MRILGLDVGEKTIGVALSDPMGWTAQGITTIRRIGISADLQALVNLIKEYEVEEVLIGLPLNMDGSQGSSAAKARKLGDALGQISSCKITYRDERLSTVAAQRTLLEGDVSRKGRKKVIDKMAAVFILQGYLDYLSKNQ